MEGSGKIIRLLGMTTSLGVHVGLAAWLLAPPTALPPEQQLVELVYVRPSAEAGLEVEAVVQEALPVQTDAVAERKQEKKVVAAKAAPAPAAAKSQPTSGPVMAEAQNALGAETADSEATPIHNIPPVYPPQARRKGREGTVLLQVEVTVDGQVKALQVADSSGYDSLDAAALDAVRQWKFHPAQRDGQLVASSLRLPIVFRLN